MNLHLRFILLALCLMSVSAVAVWSSVSALVEEVIEEWGVRYAEKQVLYDRQRTLQPIIRELELSRQFARSENLLSFARNPQDPALRQQALQEMENFRFSFLEMNYFVALKKSGEYFHNDANNTYQGRQLRYRLDPGNPNDAWFYHLIEKERDLHININHDTELNVTKLWIDILLRDKNEILGVIGTGLDLDGLLNLVNSDLEDGVTNIFTDYYGAIQLYHDKSLINYSSMTRPAGELNKVEQLLSNKADRLWLQQAFKDTHQLNNSVTSHYVEISGSRNLMAVSYLPEIDWFAITLIDIDAMLPLSRFSAVFITYLLGMLMLALTLYLAMRWMIFRPLKQLTRAVEQLKQDQPVTTPLAANGEVGLLMQHFSEMAGRIAENQAELKQKVLERSRELKIAARTDCMTGLLNRRGMMQTLQEKFTSEQRELALIWLDLDFFKEINDHFGHEQGDKALLKVAGILQQQLDIRGLGISAHWAGDELLACVITDRPDTLLNICEGIRREIEHCRPDYLQQKKPAIPLTVSIGAYIVRPGDSLDEAIQFADAARYEAKASGRNTVRLFNTPASAQTPAPPDVSLTE